MSSSPLHFFRYVITIVIAAARLGHTLCEFWSRPFSSRHSCRRPVRSWWRCWVACLMRMILHTRPRSVVSIPALCPVQPSFGVPTRDDRWHWPSSVCPLTSGSLAACLSTGVRQCSIDSFVNRSQSCGSH